MANRASYDNAFKRAALDAVLREYASFFNVAKYIDDTRSLFLLTMCAMIDMAKNCHGEIADKQAQGETGTATWVDPWDLDRLVKDDKRYFSYANWPCNNRELDAEQCYQRMLKVIEDAPFI